MSVPKWRRSESRLDAFYEAVKLSQTITQMVMRSYGMKLDKPKRLILKQVHGAGMRIDLCDNELFRT